MDFNFFETTTREIYVRENAGDRAYFEARLATHISLRRSSGMVIGREQFLNEMKAGGDRELVAMGSVTVVGKDRVCVSAQCRSGGKIIDNLLIFVRQADAPEGWSLLAWANELVCA